MKGFISSFICCCSGFDPTNAGIVLFQIISNNSQEYFRMIPSYLIGCVLASLLSIIHTTSSIPTAFTVEPETLGTTLFIRALDSYEDCSDAQKTKLGHAFADAATLASWAIDKDHPMDTCKTSYVPFVSELDGLLTGHSFTHYLRPEDADPAIKMWDLIRQNNAASDALFHFRVKCIHQINEVCLKGS